MKEFFSRKQDFFSYIFFRIFVWFFFAWQSISFYFLLCVLHLFLSFSSIVRCLILIWLVFNKVSFIHRSVYLYVLFFLCFLWNLILLCIILWVSVALGTHIANYLKFMIFLLLCWVDIISNYKGFLQANFFVWKFWIYYEFWVKDLNILWISNLSWFQLVLKIN